MKPIRWVVLIILAPFRLLRSLWRDYIAAIDAEDRGPAPE